MEGIEFHLVKSGGVLYVTGVTCMLLPGCMSGERATVLKYLRDAEAGT